MVAVGVRQGQRCPRRPGPYGPGSRSRPHPSHSGRALGGHGTAKHATKIAERRTPPSHAAVLRADRRVEGRPMSMWLRPAPCDRARGRDARAYGRGCARPRLRRRRRDPRLDRSAGWLRRPVGHVRAPPDPRGGRGSVPAAARLRPGAGHRVRQRGHPHPRRDADGVVRLVAGTSRDDRPARRPVELRRDDRVRRPAPHRPRRRLARSRAGSGCGRSAPEGWRRSGSRWRWPQPVPVCPSRGVRWSPRALWPGSASPSSSSPSSGRSEAAAAWAGRRWRWRRSCPRSRPPRTTCRPSRSPPGTSASPSRSSTTGGCSRPPTSTRRGPACSRPPRSSRSRPAGRTSCSTRRSGASSPPG